MILFHTISSHSPTTLRPSVPVNVSKMPSDASPILRQVPPNRPLQQAFSNPQQPINTNQGASRMSVVGPPRPVPSDMASPVASNSPLPINQRESGQPPRLSAPQPQYTPSLQQSMNINQGASRMSAVEPPRSASPSTASIVASNSPLPINQRESWQPPRFSAPQPQYTPPLQQSMNMNQGAFPMSIAESRSSVLSSAQPSDIYLSGGDRSSQAAGRVRSKSPMPAAARPTSESINGVQCKFN
ncbi:unnamed protein product [Didymodactylos carnosus]|uniref:Uncharacterized protein n=1 Tax=Didymodactylos carnosus TaxID=1234261 RepID=A0A8S2IGC4_9BILA|nr:unnamed protein product [Didymodactylos carnosus]CAF3738196.1 unnamed protein product [Didymodactylos carnosus]